MSFPAHPPYFFALVYVDVVANQPDASDVPIGTLYLATDVDDGTVYISDGSTWDTLGGGGGGSGTVTDVTSGDSSITVTDPTTTPDLSVQDSPAVGGITVTGTPSAGQVLTATDATDADWEDPSGGFLGWTEDGNDPANVDSNGGNLSVAGGEFQADDGAGLTSAIGPAAIALADSGHSSGIDIDTSNGIFSDPDGTTAFTAQNGAGATIAIDGGTMPAVNFADPSNPQDLVTLAYLEAHPGGLPTGWSEDASNPANVSSNGGDLDLSPGQLGTGDGSEVAIVSPTSVSVFSTSTSETYQMTMGIGVASTPPTGVPAFSGFPAQGGTVALDGGGMTVENAPIGASIAMVTVQTGAPSTYETPLVYDNTSVTGGLYGWDGSAYQKIGGPL